MRDLIRGGMIGICIGLVISIMQSYIFADGVYYPMNPFSTSGAYFYEHFSETTTFVIAIITWILIGFLFTLAAKIFQKENWSILKMTVTHFIIVILFFLPLSIISGWYPFKTSWIIIFLIIFISVYSLIWIITFTINIRTINKINEKLNK